MTPVTRAFKVKEVEPHIYHLSFSDHRAMTDTFMRFQEHYESPKFHGKIFSRAEFKRWYKTTTPSKKFTYYTDWGGFNIPSHILVPFYEGRFKNQSRREKDLLAAFKNKAGRFYIVASMPGQLATFKHEVAHGRFFINENYRRDVLNALAAADTGDISQWLLSIGYDEITVEDEIHAYLLTGAESFPKSIDQKRYAGLIATLRKIELKYYGSVTTRGVAKGR